MGALIETGLSNAVMATVLALLVAAIAQVCRRPAFVHSLWLLVLLKLVTPPFFAVPLFQPSTPVANAPEGSISAPPAEIPQVPGQGQLSETDRPGQETWLKPMGPVEPLAVPARVERDEAGPITATAASSPGRSPAWTERLVAWIQASWPQIVAPLWLVSSLLCFAWTGFQVRRFRRLLLYAVQAPADLQGPDPKAS